MSHNQFQLETNRYSGQTTQQVLRKSLVIAEDVVKWLANFIGQMFRQFLGK